jgi:5'-3' exonuclease
MKNNESYKLVDGSQLAVIARSIHMYQSGGQGEELRSPDGQLTTVLKGTMNILSSLARQFGGEHIIVAYDGRSPSWRYDIEPSYKGGLKPRNPESNWSRQLDEMPEHLAAFGIASLRTATLEGDDIIALLAEREDLAGQRKILISDDRDLLAYVGPETSYYSQKIKSLVTPVTFDAYTKKLFKMPEPVGTGAWSLFRAMVGDSTDRLKGVSNCGPVAACEVIRSLREHGADITGYQQPFTEIEQQLTEILPQMPAKLQKLLAPPAMDELRHTYNLVQVSNAPAEEIKEVKSAALTCPRPTPDGVREKLTGLGFKQWMDDHKWISRFSSSEHDISPSV